MRYAVIVVGYNRPDSMKKLLESLCEAKYDKTCDLVLSFDYGNDQKRLIEIGKQVKWENGEKRIRAFKEKQGLRRHILQCGDLTSEYEAVIVLEDDLIVAKGFFQYVVEAVEFYKDSDKIAGISLYSHRTNPGNGRFFEAQFNGYDVFLMQYAQSWGQCWTKKMWMNFRSWYKRQKDVAADGIIPDYVTRWNAQSWLKYFIRYTAEKELFYVYPYFSLTTNRSEAGEHNTHSSSAYQVPLSYGNIKGYRFPEVNKAIKYDAYFERILDNIQLKSIQGEVILDLYGLRTNYNTADIMFSTQVLDYHIIKEIELKYRPHEVNCMVQEFGKGIYIYDLRKKEKNQDRNARLRIAKYDFKAESPRLTLAHAVDGIKVSIKNRMRKHR